MEQKVYFKVASIGGYNKADVVKYLEEMQGRFDDLKVEKDHQIADIRKENEKLNDKYEELVVENEQLKKETDAFSISKETLVKLELDAHLRAKQLITSAQEEANQILQQARQEASVLREKADQETQELTVKAQKEAEQMITSANQEVANLKETFFGQARTDLQEIRTIQAQLDILARGIAQKNKTVQQYMDQFEIKMNREEVQ